MDRPLLLTSIGLLACVVGGCTSPAPRRVHVPTREGSGRMIRHEPIKPLPADEHYTHLPPAYNDTPLVTQRPPEQRAFTEAYEKVGRPRFMVVATPSSDVGTSPRAGDISAIDYRAIETILSDWLSSSGQVSLVSSRTARPMSPSTQPQTPAEPDADVMVRVQVNPIQVGRDVREARLIAEAVNTRGGDSLGRAVVDVPMPLEKSRLNEATRFIARKLMDEMTESWTRLAMFRQTPPPAPAPAPMSAPAPAPVRPSTQPQISIPGR